MRKFLNLVDEANIEEEIEQCNICREGLQLALENVERALNTSSMSSLAMLSNVTENTTGNTPPVPSQAPTSPQGSSASTASTSLLQN
jgi:NADH:ubiquinone oxidoreductase subunit F (NADH-binding)